MKNNIII